MNTILSICRAARVGRIPVVVGLSATRAIATDAAAPAAAETRTHTLFMGVDLSVAQGGQFHHLRDVSGGSFVIDVKGRPEFVAMDRFLGLLANLRVDRALKLSRVSATLNNLKGERAYTAGNSPRVQISIQQAETAMAVSDKAAMAEVKALNTEAAASGQYELNHVETSDSLNTSHPWTWRRGGGPPLNDSEEVQIVNNARTATNGAMQAVVALNNTDHYQKRLEEELAKELYDAMEVNFEVVSAEPLNNPFVVVITRFHDQNARPGASQNWIYAKSLNPTDDQPVKVHVLQGGFPKGFVLEEFQVHLYNQGHEVATNVAPKRVPLTLDAAMLYLAMDYQRRHKGETLPAKLALTRLPPDFQPRMARRDEAALGEGGEGRSRCRGVSGRGMLAAARRRLPRHRGARPPLPTRAGKGQLHRKCRQSRADESAPDAVSPLSFPPRIP